MPSTPSSSVFEIRRAPLDGPHARLLIAALNEELARCYPEPGANHFSLDADEVAPQSGAFLLGYLGADPVACGAIRRIDVAVGEIKRMYVRPSARGQGIAKRILAALEAHARELGIARLVLETGVRQGRALALYRSAGFETIAHFGEYVGAEQSVCMGKVLCAL